MGALTDKYNRKIMLASIIILASLTQVFTGVIDSFGVLCGMRILHGCFNSATNPLAYSLVSDIIPPNQRATANSILSSGIYIGIAMSSLSILMIQSIGWRSSYIFSGIIGIISGILAVIFIKEPNRG